MVRVASHDPVGGARHIYQGVFVLRMVVAMLGLQHVGVLQYRGRQCVVLFEGHQSSGCFLRISSQCAVGLQLDRSPWGLAGVGV